MGDLNSHKAPMERKNRIWADKHTDFIRFFLKFQGTWPWLVDGQS
jgi:hypothetical protein